MNKMIETIKEVHSEDICMFKIGTFYHTYNRDCYIISYLFNYKIKELGANNKECGFPEVALNKVKSKLENLQINYLVIDRRNDYDVDEKENFKDLNKYETIYKKANKKINRTKRIERLANFLTENINEEDFTKLIGRMEEVMYERGEI